MAKRKTHPKLYRVKTFRMWSSEEGGTYRKYTVAANNRAQALVACELDADEKVLSIQHYGRYISESRTWRPQ